MSTGENEQGLRKIVDMTRMISLIVLGLHFYYYCYGAFYTWQLTAKFPDHLLLNIAKTGIFSHFHTSKIIAFVFLLLSLLGAQGRKNEKLQINTVIVYSLAGLIIYFISALLLFTPATIPTRAALYILTTITGYLLLLKGGTMLSRLITSTLHPVDIFNKKNETFPQQEQRIDNEFSINLPAEYNLKGKVRTSWINIINPFRSLLVMGTPGSGKSYFVIQHVIAQHIQKGFAMLVYDFKYDDLSLIAYNAWLTYKHHYAVAPRCYFINFEKVMHRCNPLEPATMEDITDAAESARTILMGLNREWIKRQGDFFVESPINFLTAIIWYLRKYKDGIYCTLPHVIELMQVDYDRLFSLLRTEKEIEALINPFVSAYLNDVMEQLEGQIASAKVSMAPAVFAATVLCACRKRFHT